MAELFRLPWISLQLYGDDDDDADDADDDSDQHSLTSCADGGQGVGGNEH